MKSESKIFDLILSRMCNVVNGFLVVDDEDIKNVIYEVFSSIID